MATWSTCCGPRQSAASELAVVPSTRSGSRSSNAWPARPRHAPPRQSLGPTSLHALERVPSGVAACADLRQPQLTAPCGSAFTIKTGSVFEIGHTAGLFDEPVIVDTGSVDRTRGIASAFGGEVFEFDWIDDFSAARNAGLSCCTCDYVFWMDADEVLTLTGRSRLARMFGQGLEKNTLYIMCQIVDCLRVAKGYSECLSPRLFPNLQGISWTGRVYESILPSLGIRACESRYVDVRILHYGFARVDLALNKLVRNVKLLEIDRAEHPEDLIALYRLAFTHARIGMWASSIGAFRVAQNHAEQLIGEDRINSFVNLRAAAYKLLIEIHYGLNNLMRAIRLCREARSIEPTDVGLLDLEARLLWEVGNWEESMNNYEGIKPLREYEGLRQSCNRKYEDIVSAKIHAAYMSETIGKHCGAFAIWTDLTRNSAGLFHCIPGLRRTACRVLRQAIVNPRRFFDELRYCTGGTSSESIP